MGKVIKLKKPTEPPIKPDGKKDITRNKLIALVEQTIEEKPRKLGGFVWAERPQPEWAELLGVSIATFRRIIAEPPFVRDRTHARLGNRIMVTLLRIGDGTPVKKSPRHIANVMQQLFRQKTGRNPGKHGYGCLIGLAEVWPDGHQITIFKLVLNNWLAFMAGFRLRLESGEIVPPVKKDYAKPVPYLKLNHPHLPTLRLGASVGVEMFEMHKQEQHALMLSKVHAKSGTG